AQAGRFIPKNKKMCRIFGTSLPLHVIFPDLEAETRPPPGTSKRERISPENAKRSGPPCAPAPRRNVTSFIRVGRKGGRKRQAADGQGASPPKAPLGLRSTNLTSLGGPSPIFAACTAAFAAEFPIGGPPAAHFPRRRPTLPGSSAPPPRPTLPAGGAPPAPDGRPFPRGGGGGANPSGRSSPPPPCSSPPRWLASIS